TFAMPSVEPGAIIEYRWREVRPGFSAQYTRLQFQRDIPVQRVTYYVKPLSNPYITFAMRYHPFQMENPRFAKDKNGFYSTQVTNVPAFHEESRMPPEDTVRQWILLYYTEDRKLTAQRYWPDYGRRIYEAYKPYMKVNDAIRAAATEAIGTATTDDAKLQNLFNFARARVKNAYTDEANLTAEERQKLKENKSPSDTLKQGMGSEQDIDLLFGALATAAGYDARVVTLVDRSDMFFNPNFTDDYFMYPTNIAVRVGNEWQFFDPGASHLPYGMLAWGEEGVDALISDPKEPAFVSTPMSPAAKSLERRTAKLTLTEDGTLEGDVRIEYTGHLAAEKREIFDDDSPAEREEFMRSDVRGRMSTAELTNIQLENISDPAKPLIVSYRVRVPGYAQRTGKRLFIHPAFFQSNQSALFPTTARKYPVYFPYNWSEHDTVRISLPAGFALDNAEAPQSLSGGPLTSYTVRAATADNGKTLIYERRFQFGTNEVLTFDTATYPKLKIYFDNVHEQDGHTIALKSAVSPSE
ncbi:MAG: hypothetical protein H0V88_09195, partial [Pyrinomonadaceae bacterium]|nr:hypothetical protein [Pyrinomonadaceae bacterium]